MNDTGLVIASSPADAEAVEAVEAHHAQLAGALAVKVQALFSAAASGSAQAARDELLHWAETELLPHAAAEEQQLYPAGQGLDGLRALVEAMIAEHRVIESLVAALRSSAGAVEAAATGRALQVLFDVHLAKENEQLLPALSAAPQVSIADLLAGMHEILGGHDHGHAGAGRGHAGHECTCGEADPEGYPELDARVVPHAIRHATIFGALDSVLPGSGLVLVAPHDPLPLLAQVEQRDPGAFEVSYLERGPEAWRLLFRRRSA